MSSCKLCDNPIRAKELCVYHYNKARLTRAKICIIEGCSSKNFGNKMCQKHYTRVRKYGDPHFVKLAPAGSGYITPDGYISKFINGKKILEHRMIMEEYLGRKLLSNENIHHKNGVRHDNRISNLELWAKAQPAGQRVEDQVAWAKEILLRYEGLGV